MFVGEYDAVRRFGETSKFCRMLCSNVMLQKVLFESISLLIINE